MHASRRKIGRRVAPSVLSARLAGHVAFEVQPNGELAASFYGHSAALGKFSDAATRRAQELRVGLPLSAFASGAQATNKEIALLVRRLASHGLLEFRLG
ncbi:MAG: dehydrogenase, partial [Xanthobacteraceae bacterium]